MAGDMLDRAALALHLRQRCLDGQLEERAEHMAREHLYNDHLSRKYQTEYLEYHNARWESATRDLSREMRATTGVECASACRHGNESLSVHTVNRLAVNKFRCKHTPANTHVVLTRVPHRTEQPTNK